MYKKNINYIKLIIFSVFFLFAPFSLNAATSLTDDFTGTTINTGKWTEYDTGGIGGTAGNVQQNDVLTITGDGSWNHNGLKSVQTFDRTYGDVTIEGDWQLKNSCATDSAPSVAVMYGDWVNGIQQSGTLSLIYFSGKFALYNSSTTYNLATQITCVANTTIHYKFVIRQVGGVDVYLNGSATPNGSLTIAQAPNTFTNKYILLQQKSNTIPANGNSTITLDNLLVATSDAPAAPANLTTTPASGQVALSWTAPANGGSTITDYIIQYKLSSEPSVWATFADGTSAATTTIISGLSNGLSYDFRVSAINGIGTGSFSSVVSSIPNLYVPSAPPGLIASFNSNNRINLLWTTPITDGGANITDYLVEYKLTSEPTVWTTFVDGVSTSTTSVVTGLTGGATYNFRVSAINSVGTSSNSNIVTKKAGAYLLYDDFTGTTIDTNKWIEYDSVASGGTAGKVQQNNALSMIGTSNWTTNALKSVQTFDRSIGDIVIETDWTISDCSSVTAVGGISYGDWVTNGTVANNTLMLQFSNGTFKLFHWPSAISSSASCTSGVPIHIKEVIYKAGGMDVFLNGSSTASVSLSVINAPSTFNNQPISFQQFNALNSFFDNLTVSNTGYTIPDKTVGLLSTPRDNSVELSWTTPANGGSAITDYLIQYKLSSEPSAWITFVHDASSSSAAFVTGLTNGQSYDFKVSALNINGIGTSSDITTAVPVSSVPSAPRSLLATNTISSQINLSWNVPITNGGASISDYLIEYKLSSEPTVWTTFPDGVSLASSTIVTGLTNGLYYDFRVSAINSYGVGTNSSIVTKAAVNPTSVPPVASSVAIVGQSHVSEYLLGSYVYSDENANPEGLTTYRWLRANTLGGAYSPVSGATNINYTVSTDDLNKYLKLEITPVSTVTPFTGTPVLSNAIGPISAPTYIYHILSTGQSLSLGVAGTPTLSTSQPYNNKMLNGTNFTALVEGSAETPASAMGNGITFVNGQQIVVTKHGVGGTAYSGLKKGTTPYANGIQQAIDVRNAATLLGKTSQVLGVTVVHGETDNAGGNAPYYEGYLVEWQQNYEADIKAINGQVGTIPLFTDQMDSWTTQGHATSGIPIAQLAAAEDYPGKIILVGPKYFLTYASGPHLTNTSYRWLGEYYAKVIKKVYFDKISWRPLSPDSVNLIGNVIYAKFHVPTGSLAFDTTLVKQKSNYGFEYYDSASSTSINSVEIINSDTVKITLSNSPTGTNQRLRYAYTGVASSDAGAQPDGSPRGNLRDTDPEISLSGNTLYDWAVNFDKAIASTSDTNLPVVTEFSLPATSSSLTVNISSFKATDDYSVTAYLLTESSSTPLLGDSGWLPAAQTNYTFSTQGTKTLYAWAKDEAGNISNAMSASVLILLPATRFTFSGPASGYVNSVSTNFTITPDNSYTGTITIAASGSGSTGMANIILTFVNSQSPQTFTITPISEGTVILTPTNSGGLANPSNITYSANAIPPGAPAISSLTANNINSSDINISWLTDTLSSSKLEYGLTNNYGNTTTETDTSPRVTQHSVNLGNLSSCVTYSYRVRSKNSLLNETISSGSTFTTGGCTASSTVSENISSQIDKTIGGTLILEDVNSHGLTLTIPVGFATSSANFQAHQLNKDTVLETIFTPSGVFSAGDYVYELKAMSGIANVISVFDTPLTITIAYDASDISGLDESSLKIYRWDSGAWTQLNNCTVDTRAKIATCETNHFSTFSLFGQKIVNNSNPVLQTGNSMPISWTLAPLTPVGGFRVSADSPTNNHEINLNFVAGDDTDKLAISNFSDFRNASLELFTKTKIWDICAGLEACSYGFHNVYVKFYTKYGVSSDIVNATVNYKSSMPSTIDNNKPSVSVKKMQFTKDLKQGQKNNDVKLLQQFLNSINYLVAKSGAGSKGKETTFFGSATKAALIIFQKTNNIVPASGLFGPMTRKLVNSK
ncbi:MAG: fibronectin type III domain-containing protein [Candidatus Falkowbacteria bacterium]